MMNTTSITSPQSPPLPSGCWGWVMVHHGLDPPSNGTKKVSQLVGRDRGNILIKGNKL